MQQFWWYLRLFLSLAVVAGLTIWVCTDAADWEAYVDLPEGQRLHKFSFTVLEQLAICGFMGMLIAGPLTLLVFGVRAFLAGRKNARS